MYWSRGSSFYLLPQHQTRKVFENNNSFHHMAHVVEYHKAQSMALKGMLLLLIYLTWWMHMTEVDHKT